MERKNSSPSIAYGSKVLSDTEMKYGAPKAEIFAVVTFVEKYRETEFYERLEQKQANQAEIKEGFSFLDKETYEALPLTRWLDKSGHPIPGHPELSVEKAAEIKILSKEDPVPLDLLLRSNLVQQELSRA